MADDNKSKYSNSPFAPAWAKAPQKPAATITSFGKPIPVAPEPLQPTAPATNIENGTLATPEAFCPNVEQIEELLWQDCNDDLRLYCIMDGYWAVGLYGGLLNSPDLSWAHMFQGDVATKNVQQAPFIIALERGHKLARWLIEQGWGQGWGTYFTASTRLGTMFYGSPRIHDKRFLPSNEEQLKLGNLTKGVEDPLWKMRRHFRSFSDVELEDSGRIVDFRYYDPWAIAIFLHASTTKERTHFFGPVSRFIVDGYADRCRKDNKAMAYLLDPKGEAAYDLEKRSHGETSPYHENASALAPPHRHSIFNLIRHGHIAAFESALKRAFFADMRLKLNNEVALQPFRRDISDTGMEQVSTLCNHYDIGQKDIIYAALVYAVVFGVDETRKTIENLLKEDIDKSDIADLLVNYARHQALNAGKHL